MRPSALLPAVRRELARRGIVPRSNQFIVSIHGVPIGDHTREEARRKCEEFGPLSRARWITRLVDDSTGEFVEYPQY